MNLKQSSSMMINVDYLWRIGNSFVEAITQLKVDEQKNINSINLLASMAIELLVKSYIASDICFDNKNRDEICLNLLINDKFRKFSHHLDKLLEYPNIKKMLNIEDVKRFNYTGFVDEYRITLIGEKNPLCIKTLEASRYGSFSSNKDTVKIFVTPDGEDMVSKIEDFLTKLSKLSRTRIDEVKSELQ